MDRHEETVHEENEKKETEVAKKRWIGKGIYGKGDVPIKILDDMIAVFVVTILVMIVVFALDGGYEVTFETDGGSEVTAQKLDYGDCVEIPQEPVKPGYRFVRWVTSPDEFLAEEWDFSNDKVEDTMTLYAVWEPAEITVKFDPAGGSFEDGATAFEKQVVFGETYGVLPVPEKEGWIFDGWIYSQQVINEDSIVSMTGEHVLTAKWIDPQNP